jgi:hypothetical protein
MPEAPAGMQQTLVHSTWSLKVALSSKGLTSNTRFSYNSSSYRQDRELISFVKLAYKRPRQILEYFFH